MKKKRKSTTFFPLSFVDGAESSRVPLPLFSFPFRLRLFFLDLGSGRGGRLARPDGHQSATAVVESEAGITYPTFVQFNILTI